MNKNDEFEIDISDLNEDGAGIGKRENFVFFIKDTVPGDRVIALATKIKKNYGYARLLKILSPSRERISPPCLTASACGGCQIQQLNYESQLNFKEKKVLNDLIRIGGFDKESLEGILKPIIASNRTLRYRNKAIYPIRRGTDGKIKLGFFAGRTHVIVENRDCLIGSAKNIKILETLKAFIEENKLSAYDEKSGEGLFRNILIRESNAEGSISIVIVLNQERFTKNEALVSELISKLTEVEPAIKSISLNVNKNKTNVIFGSKTINIYGPGFIKEKLGDLSFHISPLSFFQVNTVQTKKLYDTVAKFADLSGKETVWDLYCGVGSIGLYLARKAAYLYGIEEYPSAVRDAYENARINGIKNAEFFQGRVEDILKDRRSSILSTVKNPFVMILDPPRKGSDIKSLESITKISPGKVIYVSCDPATLSRDLKYLCSNGFLLKSVQPLDMFPQTVKIETICLLKSSDI